MGDKIIQLPDGRTVSFPSSMSDDDIATAISGEQSQAQPKQRSLSQQLIGTMTDPMIRMAQNANYIKSAPDWGGRIGGMIGAANAGVQQGMASVGLPQAETLLRRVPVVGNALADVVGIPSWLLSKGTSAALNALPENLGTSPESAQKLKQEIPELTANVGQAAIPYLAGKIPDMVKAAIPESLPARLIARAGKFSGSPEQVLKKSEIAAREGINPTKIQAWDKLNQTVDQLDNDIGAVAKHSDVIKTDNMMKFIEPYIDRIKQSKLRPAEAEAEVRAIVEDVYKQRGEEMPADVAHWVKKDIYKENAAAYDAQTKTGKLPSLDVKAQMKIASGILDEWKTLYPETAPLLKRQSDLLSIQKDVARSVRSEMVKSPLPNSLLLAFSPKWWLTKMIATNKNLEYNLGRVLYRARGKSNGINPFKPSEAQPYDRMINPIVSKGGGSYKYTKGDYVFFDEPRGGTIAVPKNGITPDVVKARIQQYRDATQAPSPYPEAMQALKNQ